jgi:hypothetical protein
MKNRCNGKTKSGKACRAAATAGGLCFFHGNPKMASELGREGGRKNRHVFPVNSVPLPPLESAVGIRETVTRLAAEVYAGIIDPKTASALVSLLNIQLRAIETEDMEKRIALLQSCAKGENGPNPQKGHAPDN